MIADVKGKQLCATKNSAHCLCDPDTHRAHPPLMWSLCVKFHDDRCKGKGIMRYYPFSVINALCPWPLTFWSRGQQGPSLTHGDSACKVSWGLCKGQAVMRMKPFYLTYALWPWPLTLILTGPIPDSWGVCQWSFMRIGVKGKQLCACNHFT